MQNADLIAAVLIITALLLFLRLMQLSRRNSTVTDEDDYTGRALNPDALSRADEDSLRELDRLITSRFSENE